MTNKRVLFLFLPTLLAILAVVLLSGLLQASETAVAGDGREIVVVANTTASMQPELDSVVIKWPGRVIANTPKERQFHLLEYGESFRYLGKTNSVGEFGTWLSKLQASGGGECEDAMLQALGAVARGAPDSRALVLSDSAPQGGRANLAFIMNKLVERGVNIYPLITGWCNDSELSQAAMFSLARMTGGVASVHEESESGDAVESMLDVMALPDTVLVENAALDGVQIYPLTLDSTATILGVDDWECKGTW